MRVGIDASNLRAGGGLTYLTDLLSAMEPADQGVSRVTVWGSGGVLSRLPVRRWLRLSADPALDGSLAKRLMWQRLHLGKIARSQCDVLFVPGGTYTGTFRPFVTMSHNLLPFASEERRRYGMSVTGLRLKLLSRVQGATFQRADGMIFLTAAARTLIEAALQRPPKRSVLIPHGIDHSFLSAPRAQEPMEAFSQERPFRWLYVSIVGLYKHQWNVAEAIVHLRKQGMPVRLDLVGPAEPVALRRLRSTLDAIDPNGEFVSYHGAVAHEKLASLYEEANAFVFASTCENMPIILLEAMAAGLPIVASEHPVMREVLSDAAAYANPLDSMDLARCMAEVTRRRQVRERCAQRAFERAHTFSWDACAADTLRFLVEVANTAA